MAYPLIAPPSCESFPDRAKVFMLGSLLWVQACDKSDQGNTAIE